MIKKTILLGLILCLSFSFVLAEDCVWRLSEETNGIHNTLYEDNGIIYLGTSSKILSSNDYGDSFETYASKTGISPTYLEKLSGRFAAGYYDGLYKVVDEDTFTKFLDPSPASTFQLIQSAGSYFYGSDGWDKLVYKNGMDTSSTNGLEATAILGVERITDLATKDNQLWVATQPNLKLYYSGNPSGAWSSTAKVGSHMDTIENINFISDNVYVTVKSSDGNSYIRYYTIGGSYWSNYPAQIDDVDTYNDLLMYAHNSLALVKHNDGKALVYKQTGTNTWAEYGIGFDDIISKGDDLLKMSNGELLALVHVKGQDKTAVAKCKPNNAPIVDAGQDFTVFVGYEVTLHGTAEDPDGDGITVYGWEQPGAKIVDLAGSDSNTATFTPTSPGTYVFQFYATDDYLKKSEPAQVIVTVVAATKYYVELEAEKDHFSWFVGQDYTYGNALFGETNQILDFPFKIFAGDEYVVNMPDTTMGMYGVFINKPKQSFLLQYNGVEGYEFDKAAVYLRSGNNFNLAGDTLTLRITDYDGDLKAEATQFVEKSLTGKWVEFVFDADVVEGEADDNTGSDSSDDTTSNTNSNDYPPLTTLQDKTKKDEYTSTSYECVMDSHCGNDEVCKDHKCVKEQIAILEKPNICLEDDDCEQVEQCLNNKCINLNCGDNDFILNHMCRSTKDGFNIAGITIPQSMLGMIIACIVLLVVILSLGGYFLFRTKETKIDVKVNTDKAKIPKITKSKKPVKK